MSGQLNGIEQVRAIHLEKEPFSVENDLLTPSMKLRRPQVHFPLVSLSLFAFFLFWVSCCCRSRNACSCSGQICIVQYSKLLSVYLRVLSRAAEGALQSHHYQAVQRHGWCPLGLQQEMKSLCYCPYSPKARWEDH